MRDSLRHREWYQADDYLHPRGTAGVVRVNLGVINRAAQPYSAGGGRFKIFLHGEIYNDQVTHLSPLEFIFQLYEQWGLDFAARLNGSFHIVIVDEVEDTVVIATDRIAGKPLFYVNDGRTLYFSPEIKSLLLAPAVPRKLNLAAVSDFLANGFFTREHTWLDGLESLDKATVLKISAGGVVRHQYWEYALEQDGQDRGRTYYQQELAGLLQTAVGRRLRTSGTYGVLLSGGYDSRAILGCYLNETGGQPLRTVSWGEREDVPGSDCDIARRLAAGLGADHGFYPLTAEEVIEKFRDFIWFSEGITWYPVSYDVIHRVRQQQGIDVVLRGDECFGWQGLMVHDERTMFNVLMLRAMSEIGRYRRVLKPAYFRLFSDLDAENTRQVSARYSGKNLHNRKDFFYLDLRLKYFINPLNYARNVAVESFTPFLDSDILDFMTRLPVKYRLDKNLYRQTVTAMFPHLFQETARSRDDIDWAVAFRHRPEIIEFVYRQLVQEQSILDEFVDRDRLKQELDSLLRPAPAEQAGRPGSGGFKRGVLKLRQLSPGAFNLAHRSGYYWQRWRGKSRDPLPFERFIIHLLILKGWADVFLNLPAAGLARDNPAVTRPEQAAPMETKI